MLFLETFVINKNNYEEELFEIFDAIDADFNGTNGEEYLWPFAKDEGFDTNLDFSLAKNKKKHKQVVDIIDGVINDATVTWGSCYKDWKYQVIEENDLIIISVAHY